MTRIALLLSVLAAALAPSSALGAWTTPAVVPGSAGGLVTRTAISDNGTIAVTWGAANLAIRRPNGRWERTRSVATPHTSVASPDIAFDANGRLLVTWTQSPARPGQPYTGPFTVRVREWTNALGWGTVRVLGRSGHFLLAQPRLAVNVRGDAIVSWRGFRRSGRHVVEALASSLRLVGGRFGPTRLAAGGGPYRDVALDLRGNAYGVYTTYRGPQNFYVYQSRGHGWQSPRPIPGVPASKPRIGVEPDRLVVIVWRAADVDSEGNGIQAGPPWAVVGHLGNFAFPFRLSTLPVTDVAITEPGAFVTWAASDFIEHPDPGALDLHYAMRGEGFSVGGDTTVPGVRMGPSVVIFPGNPLVVYGADGAIRSVSFDRRSGRFGAPETIAANGASPSLAASHDQRRAIAAWADVDSNRLFIAERTP